MLSDKLKASSALIVSTLALPFVFRSSAFMLMYGVVWASLIWMYRTEVRGAELMGSKAKAFRLRD